MSEPSPGPGWWLASDGRWYPPKEAEQPPGPGWWLASDGKWYPPKEAEQPPGPGWWLASDGKWYPPQPTAAAPTAPTTQTPAASSSKPKPGKVGRAKGKAGRSRGRRRGATGHLPQSEPTAARPEDPAPQRPSARVEPATQPVGAMAVAAPQDRVRPNHNEGVSPLEQIERRNEASRADARVLAAKRAQAASRALGALQSELSALGTTPARRDDEVPDLFHAPPAAPRPEPPRELSTDPAPPPAPHAPAPAAPAPATAAPAAAASAGTTTAPAGPSTAPAGPLLEVKSSPLSTDLEHLGDRLAIFPDRVELRDRLDRLRQTIHRDDIVDVTVTKRLTGATLTVHSAKGIDIVAKGLRADQADEAHALIAAKTRPEGDGSSRAATAPQSAPTTRPTPATTPAPVEETRPAPAAAARPKMDQADLIAKLGDLRRAGVLTEDEYVQKVELVARLARLEELAPSRG